MKQKLLIVVGAGASVEFGLPCVADIDRRLDTCATKLCPLSSNPASNLYRHCRDEIQAYYEMTPKPAMRKQVNFEEVLYQLNLLVPYHSDPYHIHGSNALLRPISLPDVIEFGSKAKHVDGNVLRNLANGLMDELIDRFIDACALASAAKSVQIIQLRDFLTALRAEFDVGIITLNYDNLFTQACPDLYTGFDASTGVFQPLSVLRRSTWDFIYHLHGSVHFAMIGAHLDMHGITWAKTPAKGDPVHALGRNAQDSVEGTAYPPQAS